MAEILGGEKPLLWQSNVAFFWVNIQSFCILPSFSSVLFHFFSRCLRSFKERPALFIGLQSSTWLFLQLVVADTGLCLHMQVRGQGKRGCWCSVRVLQLLEPTGKVLRRNHSISELNGTLRVSHKWRFSGERKKWFSNKSKGENSGLGAQWRLQWLKRWERSWCKRANKSAWLKLRAGLHGMTVRTAG